MSGDEQIHYGWSVAVTAWREMDDIVQIRTRAYGVGTFHEEDAIEYARAETEKDYSTTLGWQFQIATYHLIVLRSNPWQAV